MRFAIVLSLWGLFTSPVMLENKSSSHLLLAWPVVLLLTTLSSPGVMPPSWLPWPPSVFPARSLFPCCSSPLRTFFPKALCSGNLGCRLYPNQLCPCISSATRSPIRCPSGSAQTQHLGMTPSAASFGRCLLRLGPECV